MKSTCPFTDLALLVLLICSLFRFIHLDTIVLAALREKFQRGVISGSGAGSAALSGTPLPVSGHSYETLVYVMDKVYNNVSPTTTTSNFQIIHIFMFWIFIIYRHGTRVHSEQASGRRGHKRNFAGCFYLTSGLGFLRSWLIEPHFNEHSLHGRLVGN